MFVYTILPFSCLSLYPSKTRYFYPPMPPMVYGRYRERLILTLASQTANCLLPGPGKILFTMITQLMDRHPTTRSLCPCVCITFLLFCVKTPFFPLHQNFAVGMRASTTHTNPELLLRNGSPDTWKNRPPGLYFENKGGRWARNGWPGAATSTPPTSSAQSVPAFFSRPGSQRQEQQQQPRLRFQKSPRASLPWPRPGP